MSDFGQTAALEAIAALVARRAGIAIPEGRRDALAAAVSRALVRTQAGSVGELIAILEETQPALDDLIAELTIAESYFFRAPEQLEFLRCEALPELRRRLGPDHRLRMLSAGCASGEEPYSLAILLDQQGLGENSMVVGADISRASLARAAEANYGEWSFRGSTEELRSRYFRRKGHRWQLIERIRNRVEFSYLNLAEENARGPLDFDVIFCRNALIYLSPGAIAIAAKRLFSSLAEGGWLFAGASDPPLATHAGFQTVLTSAGIVYRRPIPESAAWAGPAVAPAPGGSVESPSQTQQAGNELAAEVELSSDPARDIRARGDRGDVSGAIEAATCAALKLPLSAEVHFLLGVLLAEAGRGREAVEAFRRALYLGPSLALAALSLGIEQRRLGEFVAAERTLRQARTLLAARPPDELVPFGDGEPAGRLLSIVELQIHLLEERRH